ncbi:hypothetical protein L207DRAFT_638828 [Hyaloscypha variabilis F]|uniref:Uncharacterized protein n=1 Tax=Hyaloscypha variabilis (strain UAMH 11265 / GT02V1 / F) TaxID=1149755 RepID=A0A2J6R703_HYAVF|nr:hypothetical protein L207DRAFT_638828 [Hyaloscypha variabilis F]
MEIQGGWSLGATSCPNGTKTCDTGAFCCPNSLDCMKSTAAIAAVCCPGEDDCIGFVEDRNPTCADPAWSLWNATKATGTGYDFFCCLEGQIGLQSGTCGLPLLIGPPPTNEAVPVSTSSLALSGTLSATTSTITAPSSASTGTGTSSLSQQSITSLPPSTPTGGASGGTSTSAVPTTTSHTSGAVLLRNIIPIGLIVQFIILAIGAHNF